MTVNISKAIKELQAEFNRQSSNIQVIKGISQHLKASMNRNRSRR